ncbi:MAG: hypothetical protein MUC83_01785 [Pirellula sp.]|nr:hypothetical protein [Pirellula sp.]
MKSVLKLTGFGNQKVTFALAPNHRQQRINYMRTAKVKTFRWITRIFERVLCNVVLIILAIVTSGCYYNDQEYVLATYSLESEHLDRKNWPSFIARIESAAQESGISLESVAVRQIYYDEFLFHGSHSEELRDFLTAQWRLSPIEEDNPLIQSFMERLRPVGDLSDCDFFVSSSLLERDKGEQIIMCQSNDRRLLIGHYYFNF